MLKLFIRWHTQACQGDITVKTCASSVHDAHGHEATSLPGRVGSVKAEMHRKDQNIFVPKEIENGSACESFMTGNSAAFALLNTKFMQVTPNLPTPFPCLAQTLNIENFERRKSSDTLGQTTFTLIALRGHTTSFALWSGLAGYKASNLLDTLVSPSLAASCLPSAQLQVRADMEFQVSCSGWCCQLSQTS